MPLSKQMVGYYDDPGQREPTFDPGKAQPCPVCALPWTDDTVRTVSVAPMHNRQRSVFYRLHRVCAERLSPEESVDLDERAMDLAGAKGIDA